MLDHSFRDSASEEPEDLIINKESMKDFEHSARVKPHPHTTVTCASRGRSFRNEGWTERTVVIISQKKENAKTCDKTTSLLV